MLRRPLVIMAAAFAAGIALFRLGTNPMGSVFLAGTGGVLGAGLLFLCLRALHSSAGVEENRRFTAEMRRVLALVLLFSVAGMLRAAVSFSTVSRFEGQPGKQAEAAGCILKAEMKDEETVSAIVLLFPEKAEEGSGRKRLQNRERILVTINHCPDAASLTGLEAVLHGTVKKPSGAANPGTFDYELYLRSRKILYTMKTDFEQIEWTGERNGFYAVLRQIGRWKAAYGDVLTRRLGSKEAGMLRGILFGEDQFMEEEVRESFGENGIGHLLAASGLHTGFVYGLMFALCGRPRTLKGHLPVLGVLAVYAALADFSPSVMRAMLMILVSVFGRIRFFRTDFLTNVAFCGSLLLWYEPAALFSSGFQLSFTAVLSLAVLLPVPEQLFREDADEEMEDGESRLDKLYKKAGTALAGMAAIQAGMVPVILKHFHYISVAGLALNMPAIALAGWIVPAGAVLMPLSLAGEQWPVPAADALLNAAFHLEAIPLRVLLWMNGRAAAGGHSCIYLASPRAAVFLLYYGFLLFFFTESGMRFRRYCSARCRRAFALAAAAWILFGCGLGCLIDGTARGADLVYVDVGQGSCAHMRTRTSDILFDSGGSEFRDVGKDILMPYFLGNGVRDIDLAVISHLHTDHYKGLCSLKQYVPVRRLALSEAYYSMADRVEEDTGVPKERMLFLKQGDRFSFGGAAFTVLAPEHRSEQEFARLLQEDEDENNYSLVIRAEYKGKTAMFTGDISSELEMELLQSFGSALHCDILTVAHHGSRYSSCSPFLDAVSPSVCVIQVGAGNLYGHPSPETLERIEEAGAAIFRNDLQGAVMLRFGTGIRADTMHS
ncbi:MAG: DNA internalization-related competence protein ComEC/Rec2 [Firmicutes bacterium]|nr:DNA internalization-related competence protein ComEC/Rec2 [Bacillota bacterium]